MTILFKKIHCCLKAPKILFEKIHSENVFKLVPLLFGDVYSNIDRLTLNLAKLLLIMNDRNPKSFKFLYYKDSILYTTTLHLSYRSSKSLESLCKYEFLKSDLQ